MQDQEETPAAWDQIPHEPSDAYQAFQFFRESGPTRSRAAVARAFRANYQTITRWAVDWFWDDRVADFDSAQARARDAEYAKINTKNHERWAQQQALINDLSAEIVIAELREVQRRQVNGVQTMTPAELARFVRETSQQNNLAAGKPTERVDNKINIGNLSEEDRSALEALRPALEKIAKGDQ